MYRPSKYHPKCSKRYGASLAFRCTTLTGYGLSVRRAVNAVSRLADPPSTQLLRACGMPAASADRTVERHASPIPFSDWRNPKTLIP